MRRELAETIAIEALTFTLQHEPLLRGFLDTSGLDANTLRLRGADPEITAAAFDHLLSREADAARFAAMHGLTANDLLWVRAMLPGGDAPHWT